MNTLAEFREVTAYTHPDKYEWKSVRNGQMLTMPYDRIRGVHVNDGVLNECAGNTSGEFDTRTIEMPHAMASGLLIATRLIDGQGQINCHRFSRLLHPKYARSANHISAGFSSEPVELDYEKLERAKTLGLGVIGVIGVADGGVKHSLIGLGEHTTDSIQVMTTDGELGITSNEELLGFYRQLHRWSNDVDLYKVPN
jgi:hypothetical protein